MKNKMICIHIGSLKIVKIIVIFVFMSIVVIGYIQVVAKKNNTTCDIVKEGSDTISVETVDTSAPLINDETVIPLQEKIPNEWKGFPVIGKITIPTIQLDTYILASTNEKSLAVSVTKLCGPSLHMQGNFCIAGHNYKNKNMFGDVHELKVGDIIHITDSNQIKMEYKIYLIEKINSKNIECLTYNNSGNTEITLITCTASGIKRLVVKAAAIYD